MKSPKNIQKSIRITEQVAQYIEQQNGEGFNEKFCNMVMYCMEKEAELKRQEKLYKNRIEQYDIEIDKKRTVLDKLQRIEQYVNSCCNVIR